MKSKIDKPRQETTNIMILIDNVNNRCTEVPNIFHWCSSGIISGVDVETLVFKLANQQGV